MYSIREKITHLRSLHAPTHADSDLELLAKLSPKHEELHIFQLSPTRYAENILSALLDVAPAEDIRNNRRAPDDKTKETKAKEAPKAKAKPKAKTKPKAKAKQAELTEKEKELEEKADELEEKEIELEDKESELEDKEIELEEKEKELEAKEQKKSSKKKPSTPKSTGATSKTATSK